MFQMPSPTDAGISVVGMVKEEKLENGMLLEELVHMVF